MKTKNQNSRNTKANRKALLARRDGRNIARSMQRWDGAVKTLAFLARSGAVLTGVPATGLLTQKYVL